MYWHISPCSLIEKVVNQKAGVGQVELDKLQLNDGGIRDRCLSLIIGEKELHLSWYEPGTVGPGTYDLHV